MAKAKEPRSFSGVYASLLTPRRGQEIEPDVAALLEYLDRVVSAKVAGAGIDGLVLFGALGEFIHYDLNDRMRALSLACKRSRVPVLVNVSHSTIDGAFALAHHAVDSGAAGLILMPPYFYRYSDADIERFYLDLVDAVGGALPLYIDNQVLSDNCVESDLAEALLSTNRFAGLISSGTDDSELLTPVAGGFVSTVASVIPELPVALYRALKDKQNSSVDALHLRNNDLLIWLTKFPSPVGLKHIAAFRGWMPKQVPAVPATRQQESDLIAFQGFLAQWIPATLTECQVKENIGSRRV